MPIPLLATRFSYTEKARTLLFFKEPTELFFANIEFVVEFIESLQQVANDFRAREVDSQSDHGFGSTDSLYMPVRVELSVCAAGANEPMLLVGSYGLHGY